MYGVTSDIVQLLIFHDVFTSSFFRETQKNLMQTDGILMKITLPRGKVFEVID